VGNRTLAIIKPDATRKGHTGLIYDRIIKAGFKILGARLIKMTKAQAEGFYAVHRGKPFYEELTQFMSSGPCMVLVLEKENAVAAWREVIGATDPAQAAPGTIRREFATSIGENAVHGSDSDRTAREEIAFFFAEADLIALE
jgi:nucleoside-diphosphate kinase